MTLYIPRSVMVPPPEGIKARIGRPRLSGRVDRRESQDADGDGGEKDDTAGIERPKLALLNLKLPKVSGQEALRRIKSDPRTRSIPVVVLASSSEERDLAETYGPDVNSYTTEPVDFGHFSEVVRQLGLYWLVVNKAPQS